MRIFSEMETLDQMLKGKSIARYGDGEFKIARGGAIKSQESNPAITQRLRDILADPNPPYLVGIPKCDKRGPKNDYWLDFMKNPNVTRYLNENQEYGSALITRPDSAPWIDDDRYWKKVLQLWEGKHVCLVWGGSRKSLTPAMMHGAKKLDIIQSLSHHAWKDVPNILEQIDALKPKPEVCVMALGPTATGLVPDLVQRGIQALDMGHIGARMRHLFKEAKEFEPAHGFWWPNGGEEYGSRYVRRVRHLDESIKLCPKRRSVIQAGGHVGVWPKYLSKQFANVYTFEPDNMNFTALNRNVQENNVFKFQAALGVHRKRVNLVIHPANIGGHHISGEGAIPTLRIDDMGIPDVDMIVLDIEGSELDAIRGAEDTILRNKPVLHLELKGHIEKYKRGSTAALVDKLTGWGYKKVKDIGDDSIYTVS